MDTATMTQEEIRVAGLRAIFRDLGAVGMVRFLQQFETGNGDYTAERHEWLGADSIGDIVARIRDKG